MPIIHDRATDPAVHRVCIDLARRFTDIVRPLLRPEEVGECLRESYAAAREVIEKPLKQEEDFQR